MAFHGSHVHDKALYRDRGCQRGPVTIFQSLPDLKQKLVLMKTRLSEFCGPARRRVHVRSCRKTV